MTPPAFTPLYDWVMESELSNSEAQMICRVLRWGERGCFESNATIGRRLKMNPRTVRRLIKTLIRKEWLAVLYQTKHKRLIFVDPKRLTAGPLFEELGEKVRKKISARTQCG